MGDRGNIVIKGGDSEVWLYTHWSGSDLPGTLRAALRRRERWDDPQYLARIVFCQMLDGDVAGTTGFGISSVMEDGGYVPLIVDTDAATVSAGDQSWSFADYCGSPREWVYRDDGYEVTDAVAATTTPT